MKGFILILCSLSFLSCASHPKTQKAKDPKEKAAQLNEDQQQTQKYFSRFYSDRW